MKQTTRFLTVLALIFSLFSITAPAFAEEPAEPVAVQAININTATAAELSQLDGVGETKALAIVADRDANGPFESGNDLARVRGIGEATIEKNQDRITTH